MFMYKHKKKFYHRHAALKYYLFYFRFAAIFIFLLSNFTDSNYKKNFDYEK